MSKLQNALFNIFLFILFIYAGVVGYWLWWPYTPLVVESPIKILNPDHKVVAGDDLIYKITYEKKMNVQGLLTRKLVNTYKHDLRESVTTAPIGKDIDCVPVPIPKMAEPGIYNLWWSVAYKVNPLRTIIVSVESEKFEVIASNNMKSGARGIPGPRESKGDKGDKGGITIFGK